VSPPLFERGPRPNGLGPPNGPSGMLEYYVPGVINPPTRVLYGHPKSVPLYTNEKGIKAGPLLASAMKSEKTLQKLSEVRELVDGETEEMVDALAKVVSFQQDMSNVMCGAKVTLYLQPEGEWVEITKEEYEEAREDDYEYTSATPDGDVVVYKKMEYDDGQDINEYGLIERRAIVFQGNISATAPNEELWDPNEQEYRMPGDYPFGTINCIVAKGKTGTGYSDEEPEQKEFGEHYISDAEIYTSITPANGKPQALSYTPGWD